MISLGKMNRLKVSRTGAYDTYLDGGDLGEVMLAKNKLAEPKSDSDRQIGETLNVFVYIDADETVMATTIRPHVLAEECAVLTVAGLSDSGAYLDWGLTSDLFVPRSEQMGEMAIGSRCVAYAMVDQQSQRMIASTRLYKYLSDENDQNFSSGQQVELLICQQTDLGFKAVIDGSFIGLLYNNQIFTKLRVGDSCTGFIKPERADKKIDLALQKIGVQARSEIELKILDYLKRHDGELTLTDKSPPDAIYKQFGVSKKVYKNALGGLYRNRMIVISKEKVTLAESTGA